MSLSLIISKTKPASPIVDVVITDVTFFLPLFFILQVLLVVFWIGKGHREKLIFLFANLTLLIGYIIYYLISTKVPRTITYCTVLFVIEFFVVLFTESDQENERSHRSSRTRTINWGLVAIWAGLLLLILVYALFSQQIRWYFSI